MNMFQATDLLIRACIFKCSLTTLFNIMSVPLIVLTFACRFPILNTTTLMGQRGCPHGVMVKAMDYGIIVSESVLQSHYYVHIWANTLGKGMNPLILPAMG